MTESGLSNLSALSDWLRLVSMYRAPHPASQKILDVIDRLLDRPHRTHTLILGEPGTGKEGLARALHSAMSDKGAPFVKMPTGMRDPVTLALHLFGTKTQRGAIARAEGGSLFLDEIGTLPREIQARLAPVLRGRYRRNDDEEPQPCDVCVFAATDLDLASSVQTGEFRHDLYYRVSRIELTIPPLRERPGDIPRAAIWAANRLLASFGQPANARIEAEAEAGHLKVTNEAIAVLMDQSWPGNFRELDRVLERALFLTRTGKSVDAEAVRAALG